MPSYMYKPELPYGLPTTSQVQSFHTLPDTPANELERMVQELSHGLPSTDTDAVMEDDTINPMEVTYGLIGTHIDGQAGFVPVAKVIVGKHNLHGVWGVASDSIRRRLDLWGLEEFDVEI
ncbi:hypothetical protein CNMCM8980_000923 [Aspergillus fumigatiaffinis]|uniref:Uncharacterized protein n=1 Tax=Aspergillus fumigatiaffinis TaxID=340414 RepID=A0A8H4GPL1_9EURO|nr:hypothetical protein CNMCM5878_001102 [Aspergillus fumigatiaffinis]KAF4225856.1 hypothetical protein CNMCM6457_007714 [Aspergillus fumigatiaffinis]KAF4239262.1 hypothetical protein CNMCM6805_005921 [Aspergillus fumigatiaffinis]KAF4241509.1 hypothetical protein CNMCM8980_000923 [Aspergillus fumigatiaffinis]